MRFLITTGLSLPQPKFWPALEEMQKIEIFIEQYQLWRERENEDEVGCGLLILRNQPGAVAVFLKSCASSLQHVTVRLRDGAAHECSSEHDYWTRTVTLSGLPERLLLNIDE